MNLTTRRSFLAGAGSALALAGCATQSTGPSNDGTGAVMIDARVDESLDFLFTRYPATRALANRASGLLVMPLVTKAGFFVGGAYGRGALRQNGITVDYYSATSGTVGYQIGAQQFSHVLMFMTPGALREFRTSSGWSADIEAEYAFVDTGGNVSGQSLDNAEVIAFVFGQAGLALGATLRGTKYTRIDPR